MQAEAQLAAARLQTNQLDVQAAGTGADISGAEANLAISPSRLRAQAALMKGGFTTKADYDDALNEVRKAETELANARAKSNNAIGRDRAERQPAGIAAAMAAVEKARLDLRAHGDPRADQRHRRPIRPAAGRPGGD